MNANHEHSIQTIRRRLQLLLLRGFTTVVVIFTILLLGLFGLTLYRNSIPSEEQHIRSPLVGVVETYYLGRGNWSGVEILLNQKSLASSRNLSSDWHSVMLLDKNGQVLMDHGQVNTSRVATFYKPAQNEDVVPITVNGSLVGSLVFDSEIRVSPWLTVGGLLLPLLVVSIPLAGLTLLMGQMLMRRVVNPLSEVIAAAQSVAAGDLSTRVPVEGPDDLRGLSDSFNHMTAALQRSDQERRSLLADVAHELRTPLTVMRGQLEGIIDGVYPADTEHISPVLEETYMLERLVEDLRLLTLAESRQLQLDCRETNLGNLVERNVDLFGAEAGENGTKFKVDIEPNLPLVSVDPQRIEQVLGNLISNALRYTPAGSQVSVSVKRLNGSVEAAICDNGVGVPEADLPHIFDRFWRGEKSRGRATGGAGLGLAITRQLVEAHGGEIHAENVPGGGLKVAFSLPAVQKG